MFHHFLLVPAGVPYLDTIASILVIACLVMGIGIVLKKVARTAKGTTTTEATSVELPASVDSKYFNMPAGYRKK